MDLLVPQAIATGSESATGFDVAVVIGRFQPFHNGHAALLAQALACADKVIVVLGSAHAARSAKNPFTWAERAGMIGLTLDETTAERVIFLPMRDYYDERRWRTAVQAAVRAQTTPGARIVLIGHVKDASSEYLHDFPGWTLLPAPAYGEINATGLRRILFEGEERAATLTMIAPQVPAAVVDYLADWLALPCVASLREEHARVEAGKKTWGTGPFITVDAVVTAAGHVLLIERGQPPGKGQWALPGGFLEPRERVLQGAMRELQEETGFALLPSTLEGLLRGTAVFDHPDRSQRGRTITHAHWFDLGDSALPEVAGADDAAAARWVPIGELAAMESELFEDHFMILDHFLQVLPVDREGGD